MDCTAVDSWFIDMEFGSCLLTDEAADKTTTLMNIPSTDSISSLCAEDFAGLLTMEEDDYLQEPPPPHNKLQRPNDDYLSFSSSKVPENYSSTPIILNFENGNSSSAGADKKLKSRDLNPDEEALVTRALRSQDHHNSSNNNDEGADVTEKLRCVEAKKKMKRSRVRPPSENYDHIVAERKRRELLSQKFLALSTIVPGLKKLDKTSVLSDAIKYLKQLQDKVKALEAQAEKHSVESFFLVKKSATMLEDDGDDDGGGSSGVGGEGTMRPLPEIEARLFNNKILLKIQCHKRRGVMADVFRELEKLKLCIVSTNAATFGNFALDATIIAEMATDFDATMKEVVKRLHAVV